MAACIITAITVLTLKETRGISLHDVDAADAERTQERVLAAAAK